MVYPFLYIETKQNWLECEIVGALRPREGNVAHDELQYVLLIVGGEQLEGFKAGQVRGRQRRDCHNSISAH